MCSKLVWARRTCSIILEAFFPSNLASIDDTGEAFVRVGGVFIEVDSDGRAVGVGVHEETGIPAWKLNGRVLGSL